ncbi:glycoside hydrolase family 13 protein [Aeoliella sp. SH292]|uniref:glycoside hydrolase family 13 protein n=1 Tax=Aeoliella sp. SH292 TaxID=3454464 RepID=UPI003F9BF3A9
MHDEMPHELAPPPAEMPIKTPDWVKHAVFYQVFPDRFARSSRTSHLPGLRFQQWGTPPVNDGYMGGDLRGIVDKLPYLEELGVNALYLTPIFTSASNHRYHTYDYFSVDPLLGGDEALRELLDAAHEREMRVVLDGVFNHTGRGFWPFHHILENGGNSPYIDWFTIQDWPLNPYPTKPNQKTNYSAWWGLAALPKLNTDNPAVREYLYDVARHWIQFGIDGWRLDVPHEIDDDDFWRTFRQVVKGENPEAYICGEIWHEARRWLQGDQFDAVMNYLFTGPAISFFAAETFRNDYKHHHLPFKSIPAEELARLIDRMYGYYDWEINFAQLNMLDSHDMARAAWIVQDESALRLCVLFQMTMPGAPCIYYGDEVGVTGGPDPECRRAFPWHDEASWNYDLLKFYRRAVALRTTHVALRVGELKTLHAEGSIYAFRRQHESEEAVVAFNVSKKAVDVELPLPAGSSNARYRQVWPLESHQSHERTDRGIQCKVPPRDALVLVRELE